MAEDSAGDNRPETRVMLASLQLIEEQRERERRSEMRAAQRTDEAEARYEGIHSELRSLAWPGEEAGESASPLVALIASPMGLQRLSLGRATEAEVQRWTRICDLAHYLSPYHTVPAGSAAAPRVVVHGTDPSTGEHLMLFADFLRGVVGFALR